MCMDKGLKLDVNKMGLDWEKALLQGERGGAIVGRWGWPLRYPILGASSGDTSTIMADAKLACIVK